MDTELTVTEGTASVLVYVIASGNIDRDFIIELSSMDITAEGMCETVCEINELFLLLHVVNLCTQLRMTASFSMH